MEKLSKDRFVCPPSEYRPAPLWVWNDDMTKERIRFQLSELKEHGFGGAFVHPRPGMITEYLSETWFELWEYALRTAMELGLKLYIYDENSYPSGFAGGHVPSQLPDCIANSVIMKRFDRDGLTELNLADSPMLNRPGHPIAAAAYEETETPEGKKIRITHDLTRVPLSAWPEYGDRYLWFEIGQPETNPWLGGFAYPDLMRPEVTELFLKTTYEAYAERFGEHFGTAIPAVFTDEPEISPGNLFQYSGNTLPFSYWFAAEFERRNGYDLKPYLSCLFLDVDPASVDIDPLKVRYDYYSTIRELWVNNSVRPMSEWCSRHGINYTGHYLEHQWPYPWGRVSPSIMSLYEYMHWPAIDMLMTHLLKKDGTEPLLMLTIREAASAANQLGKPRVLCETYGAGGWDASFEDFKRIGDWLYVHGINFMNQHLTFATIAGARKRDHPQSFDWRQPWWDEYTRLNDYYSRLSYILSKGKARNRILVLNSTTSYYLKTPSFDNPERIFRTEHDQNADLALVQYLSDRQWDFDLGDEFIIAGHGRAEEKKFAVGSGEYSLVIVPPCMVHMKESTYEKLLQYLERGGAVISFSEGPFRIEGLPDDARSAKLTEHPNWRRAGGLDQLDAMLAKVLTKRRIEFEGIERLPQGIAHMERVLEDGSRICFIVNSGKQTVSAVLTLDGAGAEIWDPWSGSIAPAAGEAEQGRLRLSVELPPAGSLLLRVTDEAVSGAAKAAPGRSGRVGQARPAEEVSSLEIVPEQENTLIVDFCDLRVGASEYRGMYTLFAGMTVFEKHGFATNPWDNGVQFKRRLLDRDRFFGEDTGFEADYHFVIKPGELPRKLKLYAERAELYEIKVNGEIVKSVKQSDFLDHHLSEIDLIPHIKEGRNTVTLKACPFSVLHELEAIYLKGDFSVMQSEGKWVLGHPRRLSLGSWTDQGYPFYSGAVRYTKKIRIPDGFVKVAVKLQEWIGTAASVYVDGVFAGLAGAGTGNTLDITEHIKPGEHELTVRISGSLKNLLGPHHDPDKPRNLAWPAHWKKSPMFGPPPADQYDLIPCGLYQDFQVIAE